MFTRPKFTVIASVVLCLAFVNVAIAMAQVGWHGLTQIQRNALILNRAQQDNGRYTGMSCKVWVQNVVRSASGNVVNVPTNANDYTWNSSNPSSDVYRYPQPFPQRGFRPGMIIQMRWHNNNGTFSPHTAIVMNRTSSGMTFIECNWTPSGGQTVNTRTITYNNFYEKTRGLFNVYEIR